VGAGGCMGGSGNGGGGGGMNVGVGAQAWFWPPYKYIGLWPPLQILLHWLS